MDRDQLIARLRGRFQALTDPEYSAHAKLLIAQEVRNLFAQLLAKPGAPTLDGLIKGFSELTDDRGVNSFSVSVWHVPGSGFLASLLQGYGGAITIGIVATTWNYHPTAEAAVKALWEETTEIRARGLDG